MCWRYVHSTTGEHHDLSHDTQRQRYLFNEPLIQGSLEEKYTAATNYTDYSYLKYLVDAYLKNTKWLFAYWVPKLRR